MTCPRMPTGAAPGYFAIRIGKLLGARTLWIDSIANAEELSMGGQLVAEKADLVLTPMRATTLDATIGARALELIAEEEEALDREAIRQELLHLARQLAGVGGAAGPRRPVHKPSPAC